MSEHSKVEKVIQDRHGKEHMLVHYVVVASAMRADGSMRFLSFDPDDQADYITRGLLHEALMGDE